MKTGIYMIRNKINDKKYIGQAVDIDARWEQHIRELNNNKHINRYLQNAWNKYGSDNFEFTIICQCLEQDLDRLEIHYIAHYHTFYKDGGYNLTLGGDGTRGYKFTNEQRAKMIERIKEAMKEYYKDPENRKKKSEAKKEYYKDPENRKKKSEAMKEYYKDPENRKKMSVRTKEAMNRPEVRAKVSEARKKSVYCVTNDTVYAGVLEAEEELNIPGGTVSWACKGKYTSGNGHVYKKLGLEFWYLDEYEEKFGKVAI